MNSKPIKTFFFVVLAVFISALIFLICVEVSLRTGLIPSVHHRDHVTRLKPETLSENPKHKLLILGDSFLFRANEIHRELLNRLRPHSVEILNLGLPGIGPSEYLEELEKYGAPYHPDTVLLSYYVGNDLTDIQYKMDTPAKLEPAWKPFLRSIRNSFYIYHFIQERLGARAAKTIDWDLARRRGIEEPVIQSAKKGEMNCYLVELSNRHPEYLKDNFLMETDQNKMAFDLVQEKIQKIQETTEKMHARLVMVIFPGSVQINQARFPFFEKLKFEVNESFLYTDIPQRHLMDFCERRKIACLDLLSVFRAQSETEFYLNNDDHLNLQGNQLAAENIHRFLLEHEILR